MLVVKLSVSHNLAVELETEKGIGKSDKLTPDDHAPGCRALSQAVIIYLLARLLGVKIDWHPLPVAGVLLAVVVGAALFSTFSLINACLVKTSEQFMSIGQVLNMPMFFASNAMMPTWLR
jgi:ABC-2 type transport system permease protein